MNELDLDNCVGVAESGPVGHGLRRSGRRLRPGHGRMTTDASTRTTTARASSIRSRRTWTTTASATPAIPAPTTTPTTSTTTASARARPSIRLSSGIRTTARRSTTRTRRTLTLDCLGRRLRSGHRQRRLPQRGRQLPAGAQRSDQPGRRLERRGLRLRRRQCGRLGEAGPRRDAGAGPRGPLFRPQLLGKPDRLRQRRRLRIRHLCQEFNCSETAGVLRQRCRLRVR